MLRNQKGFTLMELMIVIVIIGVLAAIGIPAYKGYVDRASKGVCKANRRSLETAVQLYCVDKAVDDPSTVVIGAGTVGLYITNWEELKCRDGGTYSVGGDGKVKCSITGHDD